jgi:hypothetical protein
MAIHARIIARQSQPDTGDRPVVPQWAVEIEAPHGEGHRVDLQRPPKPAEENGSRPGWGCRDGPAPTIRTDHSRIARDSHAVVVVGPEDR